MSVVRLPLNLVARVLVAMDDFFFRCAPPPAPPSPSVELGSAAKTFAICARRDEKTKPGDDWNVWAAGRGRRPRTYRGMVARSESAKNWPVFYAKDTAHETRNKETKF